MEEAWLEDAWEAQEIIGQRAPKRVNAGICWSSGGGKGKPMLLTSFWANDSESGCLGRVRPCFARWAGQRSRCAAKLSTRSGCKATLALSKQTSKLLLRSASEPTAGDAGGWALPTNGLAESTVLALLCLAQASPNS